MKLTQEINHNTTFLKRIKLYSVINVFSVLKGRNLSNSIWTNIIVKLKKENKNKTSTGINADRN